MKFEPTGNSVYATEYFTFGKALLVRLYLQLQVHTNLLSVHSLLILMK